MAIEGRHLRSLPIQGYLFDDEHSFDFIQPALQSLYTNHHRRNQSVTSYASSSFTNSRNVRTIPDMGDQQESSDGWDHRTLEYISGYDSHLMCPICHTPFIDPIVLDCDHTFCSACFNEYVQGSPDPLRSKCPTCRTRNVLLPKTASRLISNMCDELKVRCPRDGCSTILTRGDVEQHAKRDCPEQILPCPDILCQKQTKRKNFVPGQCVHISQVECECGAIIELGRGEWRRHKDEECPHTAVRCEHCGIRLPVSEITEGHRCRSEDMGSECPGRDFGCEDEVDEHNLMPHISSCIFARLAPHLSRQSRLLSSVTDQLAHAKLRNAQLEVGLNGINDLLNNTIEPKLDEMYNQHNDIEEIHRDDMPSMATNNHQHDTLFPAHVRGFTPSPSQSHAHLHSQHNEHHDPYHYADIPFHPSGSNNDAYSINSRSQPQHQSHLQSHFLSLHDSLSTQVTHLTTDLQNLQSSFTELDARSSMALMNETLRLREELAHTNAALFSTRAQVQWLLNRERMGMVRGRQAGDGPGIASATNVGSGDGSAGGSGSGSGIGSRNENATAGGNGYSIEQTGSSSANTSPMFNATRPMPRRTSGGSQERVKL